jgi:hypothetical protein
MTTASIGAGARSAGSGTGTTAALQLFRRGDWYESYDTVSCGTVVATSDTAIATDTAGRHRLCLAPEIMIQDDIRRARAALPGWPPVGAAERRDIVARAVALFRDATVRIGGLGAQDPEAFATLLHDVVGLPSPLTRRWGELLATSVAQLPARGSDDAVVRRTPMRTPRPLSGRRRGASVR